MTRFLSIRSLIPVLALQLGAVASAQNLMAHFRLDEATGPLCNDSSSGGNTGQYIGGVQLAQAGARPGTLNSVLFNGADAGAELPGAPGIAALSSNFTVAAWAKLDDPTGYRVLLGNVNGWAVGSFYSNLRFTTRGIQDYIVPGAPVSTWFHYAVTFDASFLATFYVNGVQVGAVQGAAPPFNPATSWYIGTINGVTEWWNGSVDDVQVYDVALSPGDITALYNTPGSPLGGGLGAPYCGPAAANSTGMGSPLTASGSTSVAANDVTLTASSLPPNQFGFFLTSRTQGFVTNPGGSQGNLCLSGVIGRYVGPGLIQNAGPGGAFSMALDLTRTPSGAVFVSVLQGETRSFQAWYRDLGPGGAPASNFTEGRVLVFQ